MTRFYFDFIIDYRICIPFCLLFPLGVESSCELPYKETDGKHLNANSQKFYTASPFKTTDQTTEGNCHMRFIAEARAVSMNIVDGNDSKVECQFFDKKAGDHGILTEKDSSTYYEKVENYVRATSHALTVGIKDDRPGIFTFQLPTGFYKIKLNHLHGGFICNPDLSIPMPFGCFFNFGPQPSRIRLHKDSRGDVLTGYGQFNAYHGNGMDTSFIATTVCKHFKENSIYSFWHVDDFADSENGKSGETSFEMFVQLCEISNVCF